MIACDFCAIKLRNFYDFRDADLDAPICNHHVGMMNPVLFFSDFDAVALPAPEAPEVQVYPPAVKLGNCPFLKLVDSVLYVN